MRARVRTFTHRLLIMGVVAGYALVAIDQVFGIDASPRITENRYRAKMPNPLEAESLSTFRAGFENYARDHLGFRNFLIRTNSLVGLKILSKSKLDSGEATVYVGPDDWMYFGYTLRDYMGLRLDAGQLRWWERAFRDRVQMLAEYDVPYLFFAAPVKVSIYPEHLPPTIRRAPGPLVLDQLITQIQPGERWDIMDLREPMRRAKDWHLLYWKTDHHWNSPGAAVATRAIVEKIREWFPSEPEMELAEYNCEEAPTQGDTSLSRLLGLGDRYRETEHTLHHQSWQEIERSFHEETGDRIYRNPHRPDGLRVVTIGDSFHFELMRFYQQRFGYIRWVSHLGTDYMAADLQKVIEEERPDLVLEERAEWGLLEVPSLPDEWSPDR